MAAAQPPKPVARINGLLITGQDVTHRVGAEKAYGSKTYEKAVALISLVNDFIEYEVAATHKVKATDVEIRTFGEHADRTSKAPEILAKVKKVFKDDRRAYERLYLSPKVLNRKFRYWYSRNAELHRKEQRLIESAYDRAASGISLKEAASQVGLEYSVYDVEDKVAPPAAELARYMEPEADEKDPLIAILEPLASGALYDHIVESDQDYRVVRLLARAVKKYSIEAVIARKRPFDDWFRDEAAKLKIEIVDPKLKESIKKSYPDLWWVKNL